MKIYYFIYISDIPKFIAQCAEHNKFPILRIYLRKNVDKLINSYVLIILVNKNAEFLLYN